MREENCPSMTSRCEVLPLLCTLLCLGEGVESSATDSAAPSAARPEDGWLTPLVFSC